MDLVVLGSDERREQLCTGTPFQTSAPHQRRTFETYIWLTCNRSTRQIFSGLGFQTCYPPTQHLTIGRGYFPRQWQIRTVL
ncbi:hypothetical protein AVEN_189250-1 [Araneus ventricosus]|uniref:Uncharacterized protein n=1 Tax=Araneus ventricosus TaxID=182803 RepID=A0A4Y2T988_ARAVE|nr:hypothetical protein AVEN_189250-1 [Araneus ventricosus]